MANFVAQDDVQNIRSGGITVAAQFALDVGCYIETACFQQTWHQRHAGERVMRGFFGHFPKAGMRGEVTIVFAKATQVVAQQAEVISLFSRNAQPVGIKLSWQSRKTLHCIQRQIDCVELDMREGVNQRGMIFRAVELSSRHAAGRGKLRAIRDAGDINRCFEVGAEIQFFGLPLRPKLGCIRLFYGAIRFR